MEEEDEEYDKFGQELERVQVAMKSFHIGQVSGWDDDAEGLEEEVNPFESPDKEILWASENGKLSAVERLILIDPMLIHVKDKDGYTPLHRACYNGHEHVVDLLLSHGANISAETVDGWQPLHSACKWNNAGCVAKLLEHGADPNAASNGGQTPLHLAASNSCAKDTLQVLLLHPDIQTDLKNRAGESAADLARRCGKYSCFFEMAETCINIL
ncbi:ankyrin repeat domain-containing protein 49-like isoform X2 [Zootermopsis nevadensis]|uniref:ankyrin repeat domain-containing protein 49-like isoform X2 n=1 Tax=Zootermopsis nevadensis TaxID=136037 RepID=UPI000B8E4B1C|nr:ankyrin repeat domain-containing protein 49-like isoform X2 [Zootermopsis nevadensis]